MRTRAVVYVVGMVVALVGGVLIGGWGSGRDDGDPGPGAGPLVRIDGQLIGLVTEDSCPDLLGWFKERSKTFYGGDEYFATDDGAVRRMGDAVTTESSSDSAGPTAGASATAGRAVSTPSAAPRPASGGASNQELKAGVDFSATNVQEADVDEPDLVKTDGSVLVTLAGGHLRVVDVRGDSPKLVSSLPLQDLAATSLLLVGDRVMVFGEELVRGDVGVGSGDDIGLSEPVPMPMPAPGIRGGGGGVVAPDIYWGGNGRTAVIVADIGDPAAPEVVGRVGLDGSFVAARLVDGVARVVLRSSPTWMSQGKDVSATEIEDWLPSYEYTEPGRESAAVDGRLVECGNVHHPVDVRDPSTVTVVSVDPVDPRPGNGASVAGAGETVYASGQRLYVSSTRWSDTSGAPGTDIHAFDISDKVTTRYVGSGGVGGNLLNQFSLSEHNGFLRAATTTMDPTTGVSESQVVVMALRDGGLHVVGSVGGLGKTEQIRAVRFLGDLGYVVTFRQTDPLYVVDLSNPTSPVVRGELKIPGFSSYLHPIGDGRLLGIGQNATEEGRLLGSQISLFDVSDPGSPKQLSTFPLGRFGSSEAEYDHHAFLWWAASSLAVVPVDVGAVGVRVDGSSLVAHGGGLSSPLRHPTGYPIRRSLVIGSSLLTLSESGVSSVRLSDFGGGVWTAF